VVSNWVRPKKTAPKNNLRFPIIFQRVLPQRPAGINQDYPKKVAIPPPGYSRHTSDVETSLQSKSLLHKHTQNQREFYKRNILECKLFFKIEFWSKIKIK